MRRILRSSCPRATTVFLIVRFDAQLLCHNVGERQYWHCIYDTQELYPSLAAAAAAALPLAHDWLQWGRLAVLVSELLKPQYGTN